MKRGFGLIEVLIAAVVLGFLIVGLGILQKGNREAVLRIRARDAAQALAQNVLDSLSRAGVSSLETGQSETETVYEWSGRDGKLVSKVSYTVSATVSSVAALDSYEASKFTNLTNADTLHSPARKVDLTVSWPFKGNSPQSISVSRIVR